MNYRIISTRKEEKSLIVTVDYYFGEETVRMVVPIYMARNKEAIISGLKNRYDSELAKREYDENIDSIIDELVIGEDLSFD